MSANLIVQRHEPRLRLPRAGRAARRCSRAGGRRDIRVVWAARRAVGEVCGDAPGAWRLGRRPRRRDAAELGRIRGAALRRAARLGAVVVPLNFLLAEPEVEERASPSSRRRCVDSRHAALESGEPLRDVIARDAADPAVILFTSGTSGRPKGATLTHGRHPRRVDERRSGARSSARATSCSARRRSRTCSGYRRASSRRSRTEARSPSCARFDARQTLATDGRDAARRSCSACRRCASRSAEAARAPPSGCRLCGSRMSAAPRSRRRSVRLRGALRRRRLRGLRDDGDVAASRRPTAPARRASPARSGVPLGGTEIRIDGADERGVGEVTFRGPSVIPGYWNDPKATAEAIYADGWLATGDMGYLDDDGYLFLVDRKKELIIRGGYNVYPREVEEALYAHPDVLEAAVIGVPRRPARRGGRGARRLRARARRRRPTSLTATGRRSGSRPTSTRAGSSSSTTLPKGPTGKILKRAIDVETLFAS